jgi:hypothetical protein
MDVVCCETPSVARLCTVKLQKWLNNEWERVWKEAAVAYTDMCLGDWRNPQKNQDTRSRSRDFYLGPPEY